MLTFSYFTAGAFVAAYLLGSLSAAIITCKLMRLPDPRTTGSRNPGTTNVLRSGGKKAAAVTLLGDMLKGLLAVVAVRYAGGDSTALAAAGLGAFLGHLYPVYFQFQGGKGVATALGVIYGLHWPIGLLTTSTWLAMAVVFRYSSLAALVAIVLTPLWFLWLMPEPAIIGAMSAMTGLLFWRHRSNISNLLTGKEGKIGFGKEDNG